MQTRLLRVNEHEVDVDVDVDVDSEGYLVNLSDWFEAFVRAQAEQEGLALTDEIWEVIRYLRDFYEQHEVQANVLEIIKHLHRVWRSELGSNRYLHSIFPRGGPQQQGNRLAGLQCTKGEH